MGVHTIFSGRPSNPGSAVIFFQKKGFSFPIFALINPDIEIVRNRIIMKLEGFSDILRQFPAILITQIFSESPRHFTPHLDFWVFWAIFLYFKVKENSPKYPKIEVCVQMSRALKINLWY